MAGYGRIFSIAGANINHRNLFLNRNVFSNIQLYATLTGKALLKLGLPMKPKRPLTPFFKFMKNERLKVIQENANMDSQTVIKTVAQNWASYDAAGKEVLHKAYDLELLNYSKQVMTYEQSITPEQKKIIRDAKIRQHEKLEKRKLKKKIELLGKPRKPATAFIQYLQERKITRKDDEKAIEWMRKVADAWRAMSLEEKAKYQVEGQKLMEQYQRDMREWEVKMVRLGHIDVVRNSGLLDLKSPKSE